MKIVLACRQNKNQKLVDGSEILPSGGKIKQKLRLILDKEHIYIYAATCSMNGHIGSHIRTSLLKK